MCIYVLPEIIPSYACVLLLWAPASIDGVSSGSRKLSTVLLQHLTDYRMKRTSSTMNPMTPSMSNDSFARPLLEDEYDAAAGVFTVASNATMADSSADNTRS